MAIPEFVRARKAMQYSASIDDFARIMKEGNNGGYANTWLVADSKNNEIASLELGLKHVTLRADQGRLLRGLEFPGESGTDSRGDARISGEGHGHQRQRAARPLGSVDGREQRHGSTWTQPSASWPITTIRSTRRPSRASGRCAATSIFRRADRKPWQPEYGPAGAVQNKVADGVDGRRRWRSLRRWAIPAGWTSKPRSI